VLCSNTSWAGSLRFVHRRWRISFVSRATSSSSTRLVAPERLGMQCEWRNGLPSSEPLLLVRTGRPEEGVRKFAVWDPHWIHVHVAVHGHSFGRFRQHECGIGDDQDACIEWYRVPNQWRRHELLGQRNPNLHRTETLKFNWKHIVKPHVRCTPYAGSVER
jgi:hypothetical protein